MPIEQMNISLPPRMAQFIRGKVKQGQYTDASEVVRDAVRHMQEAEAARRELALLENFEAHLPQSQREGIRRGVRRGIRDIEAGRFEEYDEDGLRGLAKELVVSSGKNKPPAKKRDDVRV